MTPRPGAGRAWPPETLLPPFSYSPLSLPLWSHLSLRVWRETTGVSSSPQNTNKRDRDAISPRGEGCQFSLCKECWRRDTARREAPAWPAAAAPEAASLTRAMLATNTNQGLRTLTSHANTCGETCCGAPLPQPQPPPGRSLAVNPWP